MRKQILISLALVALCAGVFVIPGIGNETPDYKVISTDGAFEIREYQPMLLVSTTMRGSELRNSSPFNRLFRYITGSNKDGAKIAMTAPVFSSRDSKVYTMSFLIPKAVAEAGAPTPSDERVKITEMKGGRFASFRYSGYSTRNKVLLGEEKLARWLKKKKLESVGPMINAGYDAPYTPPQLRRNEILVRLAPSKAKESEK